MANLTINFNQKLNTSLQTGDIVYYQKNGNIKVDTSGNIFIYS